MKLRFYDMISLYIEKEKQKFYREVEVIKKGILEGFAYYLDESKKKVWSLEDINALDGKGYYQKLLSEKSSLASVERHIQVLNNFMEFAIDQGWLLERPWERLFKHPETKKSYFHVNEEERKKLFEYMRKFAPGDFFGKRDRAVMLLHLAYKLRKTEISQLNTTDYNGKSIKITSPFTWRSREIPLSKVEIKAIDDYLVERAKRKNVTNREALFLGSKGGRFSPGMIRGVLDIYRVKAKEE